MKGRQWISYLFIIAFAMALIHNILPHTHPKEIDETENHHHAIESTSHEHKGGPHHHSHSHDSDEQLPVFTHFANSDFTVEKKFTHTEKQKVVIQFVRPILVSFALPTFTFLPSPIPNARDLPLGFLPSIQSLRAPPYFHI